MSVLPLPPPVETSMPLAAEIAMQREMPVRPEATPRPSERRYEPRLVLFSRKGDEKLDWVSTAPFLVFHVAAVVGVALVGFSWSGLILAVALYYIRMFGVTAGYHRYFGHATYKTSRVMQFLLAVLAMSSSQKGVLWWAGHHRIHHRYSDKPQDVHSRRLHGFFWAHMGWILSHQYEETEWDQIKEYAKYPELRWLNKYWAVVPTALGVGIFLAGGWHALVWGFLVSTVLLWHGTFTINSFSHWLGSRRYQTTDDSRNNFILSLVTLGEGWHNNHHYYPKACNQGFYWWELDITYYVLRGMQFLGLIWEMQTPPKAVRDRRMPARRREAVSAS